MSATTPLAINTGNTYPAGNCIAYVPLKYRYTRLVVSSVITAFYVEGAEIKLMDVLGGATVTGVGQIYTATDMDVNNPIEQAFDGNTSTIFGTTVSPTLPWTVTVDHGVGNEKAIIQVAWMPRADRVGTSPAVLDIQGSNDGSTWTTLWPETGITPYTAGVYKVFTRP